MKNLINKRMALLIGTGALGMRFWIDACKECNSIENHDSTGVAIRKATNSVLNGMLYCCSIYVICHELI